MPLIPNYEGRYEGRRSVFGASGWRRAWADAALNQVSMKELHTEMRVISSLAAAAARATAEYQVSSKGLQRVYINLSQHTTSALNKYSKVGRCADVSNRGGVDVSFFGKRLGEPINVRPAQSRA
jgi:hypothetical protein